MTTLLIQTENIPLMVNFPAIIQMSHEQFYEFCQANRELRIERTATGEVIIMPPTFSDTGNRSGRAFQQLVNWADQNATGETFDSSTGFTLPNEATRSPDAYGALLGFLIDRKNRSVHLYRSNQTPEILNAPDSVSAHPELPGFMLWMAKIW